MKRDDRRFIILPVVLILAAAMFASSFGTDNSNEFTGMVTGVTSDSGRGSALTTLALNDQSTAFYCEKSGEKCSCNTFLENGQYCEAGEDEMCQGCMSDNTECQTPNGDSGKMCKCFYTCQ